MNDISTTGTTYPKPWEYCSYRLPCGLCQRTNMLCPYYTNTMEITCEKVNDLPYTINYCGDVIEK